MRNLVPKKLTLATLLIASFSFAGEKAKKKPASKVQPILINIKLGKENLELRVHNTDIARDLQNEFGKEIVVPFVNNEKESLEGYKGIDEQTQRQMLCADINDTVDLLVASTEATSVSKIDAKTQKKILMLKVLQEQIALTWAYKNFFGKGHAKVTAKEIRDTMRVELPLGLPVDEVRVYFCSPNSECKVSDCD